MQILRTTNLEAFKKAKKLGAERIINLLKEKNLTGRGGAGFPTGKKWEFTLNAKSDVKYVICNADEGEPGTFKDKFIIKNNPETLVEGILIAAYAINAKQAFIYLRGEYENLKSSLQRTIDKLVKKSGMKIDIAIISGAGAYVCGEETAIIRSIEGYRPHPYYKPPFPALEGLFGKPTIINNVETLANVPQAILFDEWDSSLRLMSLSGNVAKPGIYELPIGCKLTELIKKGKPENNVKAVYFGCFGGCMPYSEIELTPDSVCGKNCVIGSYTIIVVDEKHSILDVALSISEFYCNESCGKCTPCREGTVRVLNLLKKIRAGKATKADLNVLEDLAKNIHETSLCGLGQTSTNHLLTALKFFRKDFEDKLR
ncbi:NADH-quinone oxidoreductase subunit F [Candidatus Woesearchaeota archaeon]|nr:NADH-quinone oxidoreductase subunit F [Candidatus Woesearchaeota archaeon]